MDLRYRRQNSYTIRASANSPKAPCRSEAKLPPPPERDSSETGLETTSEYHFNIVEEKFTIYKQSLRFTKIVNIVKQVPGRCWSWRHLFCFLGGSVESKTLRCNLVGSLYQYVIYVSVPIYDVVCVFVVVFV
ncbi:hypothetical protein ANN_13915 [Periplaneta americana]|uniref:Uncharacterized protein n=1 Tax=Periplaneta americana TaxID=6978 RepID=A0ABQ8SW33_PERAM|nr:hypothetical protein ANN_13915 [Periplaneta americana]